MKLICAMRWGLMCRGRRRFSGEKREVVDRAALRLCLPARSGHVRACPALIPTPLLWASAWSQRNPCYQDYFYPRKYFTTASVREWTWSFSYTVRT